MFIRTFISFERTQHNFSNTLYRSACTTRVSQEHRWHGYGGGRAVRPRRYTYVQSRYCFAARRPRRGSKQYLSHAPPSLRRPPTEATHHHPAGSLLQKPLGERGVPRGGAEKRRGAFSVRPSRLDSSRVTASSAVSQAPSGSIRLPPLRPQLPPPSTAKSNAPTAPAPAPAISNPILFLLPARSHLLRARESLQPSLPCYSSSSRSGCCLLPARAESSWVELSHRPGQKTSAARASDSYPPVLPPGDRPLLAVPNPPGFDHPNTPILPPSPPRPPSTNRAPTAFTP